MDEGKRGLPVSQEASSSIDDSPARRGAPPLNVVSARPPLGDYLSQLWKRRHFMRMQAVSMALGQHQATLLGNLWLVLGPLLDGLFYFFIFSVLFPRGGATDNFFGYVLIGLFLFTFTARCMSSCVGIIEGSRGLIRAFQFPRAALPISVVMRELVALLPVIYTLVILVLVVPPKAELTWRWLLVPLVVALQAIFNLGAGFFLARLGARMPDVQHLVPYLVRFLMYGSAVIFSIERFKAVPLVYAMIENSPLFLILDISRQLILWGQTPPAEQWLKLTAWSVVFLVGGFLYFWQAEVKYARRAHE